MNKVSETKTGNKFPVFNFGSDLMNLKFLIVLTMVLCAFCVFPVNALIELSYQSGTVNLGEIPDNTITIYHQQYAPTGSIITNLYINGVDQGQLNSYAYQSQTSYYKWDIPVNTQSNSVSTSFILRIAQTGAIVQPSPMVITYTYNPSAPPANEFDIDIDLQEQTLELGQINSLEQTFYIGSSSGRVIRDYRTYRTQLCTVDDLQQNYVKIKFNKDFLNDTPQIFLSGAALLDTTESEFDTLVKFNFTYLDALQAFIQTYDYQNGNMLSGVNISVYEVIEEDNTLTIGDLIYSSSNSESQTILNLKQDTEYFVKNEKAGYFSVKNTEYDYLNGETGYLWNPSLDNPLRLYYSRLDASAQYNANFIVQDVNNNGISGVSVTMDNAVTKISNSIGGLTFNNISAGTHTFVFVKNGYQTVQQTLDIQLQYAAFYQTMYKENLIVQPTVSPSVYPTVQPTVSPTLQPTISPIDQPTNLGESIKYGLAKIFGVNSLNTINLIFALLIIMFPAVVGAVVTNQALGFISGGLIGFVFALGIGLIPIWVFFSMIMLSVIYLVMTHTEAGF